MIYKKRNFFLLLLLLPTVILLLFIYIIPISQTIISSFKNLLGTKFIGLTNYKEINGYIGPTLWRTIIWTFGSVIPAMILGLLAAVLYREDFKGKGFMFNLVLLPYSIPLVIVATLWSVVYNPTYGLINMILLRLKLISEPIIFLSKDHAMFAVIVARFWRAFPFAFLSYSAGLSIIPKQLYEAASIDGANGRQQFFKITIPLLKDTTLVTGLVLTIWTAMVFDIIFAMTGGGPGDATMILPIEIYTKVMEINDMGAASAIVIYSIIFLLTFSLLYWKLVKRNED